MVTHVAKAVVFAFLHGMETHAALAREFGYKTTAPIKRILALPWAVSMIDRARQAAETQLLAEAVPAQVHLRRASADTI